MFSCNQACHKNDVQEGCLVESGRRVMVAHNAKLNKDCALRSASAMTIDLSKFGSIPGRNMESRSVILYVFPVLRRPFRLDN